MACQLEIVSQHRDIVGDDAVRVFDNQGGTIGRSLQADWCLPDPDRYISGKHATIDFNGGSYYLIDTSSNGVYVNDDREPIGKGNVRRLFDGDVLKFGDFEINVTIDEGESIATPLDEPESKVREHVATLVPEESLATGVQLLDEDELTGDNAFQSALFEAPPEPDDPVEAAPPLPPEPPRHSVPRELAESDLVATDLIDSFLDGLGINRAELPSSVDLAQIMQNAGEVLREFVAGTTNLIESRANMKNAFKLDQTVVLPRHNNPLKLSANAKAAVKLLLVGKDGEYLGARDAAREVCNDLLYHQDAMLSAMAHAFDGFAGRLAPQELAETFDDSLGRNPLLRWRNKSKYWRMYCDAFPSLTAKGGGQYPQAFAEEFVSAYERQFTELKRLGPDALHLKETVVMKESERGFIPPVMLGPHSDEVPGEDVPAEQEEPAREKVKAADDFEIQEIELNESAARVLKELERLERNAGAANDMINPEGEAQDDEHGDAISLDDEALADTPGVDTLPEIPRGRAKL